MLNKFKLCNQIINITLWGWEHFSFYAFETVRFTKFWCLSRTNLAILSLKKKKEVEGKLSGIHKALQSKCTIANKKKRSPTACLTNVN